MIYKHFRKGMRWKQQAQMIEPREKNMYLEK